MKLYEDYGELEAAIAADFAGQDVLYHGTNRQIEPGEFLIPRQSSEPAGFTDGSVLDWRKHPARVFASQLAHKAVWHATIRRHGVSYCCGARGDRSNQTIDYMADPLVKEWVRLAKPVGRIAVVSSKDFEPSLVPDIWYEQTSEKETLVLGVYSVSYRAFPFKLDDLPPNAPQGMTEEVRLARSAQAALGLKKLIDDELRCQEGSQI